MKVFKLMAIAAFVAMGFVACEKSEEELVTNVSATLDERALDIKPVFNKENPFDVYGEKMMEFYLAEKILFSNPLFKDRIKYESAFDSLLIKYNGILYPSMDTTGIDEYQTSLLKELFSDVNFENLKELSLKTEKAIISDTKMNSFQKNRLLSIVSQFKYGYFYNGTIIYPNVMSWEDRFDNCMSRELNVIFADDGNPVPEAGFCAGMPHSMLWLEGSCAWEASFC